ncbi:hypothetical protein J4216_03980 [Candidatus Woesearchaeota archaeon]|nr:hypothetical protein [Candidatus Woesearchaeota archaeon]
MKMLNPELIKSINEFVYKQPRAVQEIAELLSCSWITADKYTAHISEKYGTIKTKKFRGGTRGALKIVYWANLEGIKTNTAQQIILEKIKKTTKKYDFNPFDIYNLVNKEKKNVEVIKKCGEQSISEIIKKTKTQLLIFSGNISFINKEEDNKKVIDIIRELAEKGINIKILCRIDIASIRNIKKIIEINKSLGRDLIEIKHIEQPLRGFVIDYSLVRLRDEKLKVDYKEGEIDYDHYLLYNIHDQEWVEWIEKVFFNLHSNSLPLETRLHDLEEIEELLVNMN